MNGQIQQFVNNVVWAQALPPNPDRVYLKISGDGQHVSWWYLGQGSPSSFGMAVPTTAVGDELHHRDVGELITQSLWIRGGTAGTVITVIEGFR